MNIRGYKMPISTLTNAILNIYRYQSEMANLKEALK